MSELENRITSLEIKFSLQEEFINELNQIIIKQKNEIIGITEYLKSIEQSSDQGGNNSSLKNEAPPHY